MVCPPLPSPNCPSSWLPLPPFLPLVLAAPFQYSPFPPQALALAVPAPVLLVSRGPRLAATINILTTLSWSPTAILAALALALFITAHGLASSHNPLSRLPPSPPFSWFRPLRPRPPFSRLPLVTTFSRLLSHSSLILVATLAPRGLLSRASRPRGLFLQPSPLPPFSRLSPVLTVPSLAAPTTRPSFSRPHSCGSVLEEPIFAAPILTALALAGFACSRGPFSCHSLCLHSRRSCPRLPLHDPHSHDPCLLLPRLPFIFLHKISEPVMPFLHLLPLDH
ncbi:hypothetical protein BOTBODRAFT_177968 [Botryobasidium botryosum FD-172 SS1]|uniref:Uncharacterized protein n=1 Tax=Botryobasidium botryosum (strain FD-172 SS1) TaxID=930990 RepID=A0A067MGH5_BOTB1|nr:hypothetical protein BOTBODRAFT_177968 [Botryobasidium botryosum FD-172 SS1]